MFWIFLRLGLTSFGGPIAHLGYFREEFVNKRKWFDDPSYADVVALCQFLPGPASSQVGISIGLSRAGIPGAIAAWLGFTLPSAVVLVAFAFGISIYNESLSAGWLHGLKVVAVAIVAQAIWGMAKSLTPDFRRVLIALGSAGLAILFPTAMGQMGVIVLGAILGLIFIQGIAIPPQTPIRIPLSRRAGIVSLVIFASLLVALPFWGSGHENVKIIDSFFRTGSLVFGGGHVVLPLLKSEIVNNGWVSSDAFMAGYGAVQAVPGPLFTFAAYLGAMLNTELTGWIGAGVCLLAVFLPSFLIVFGVLPFWEKLRQIQKMRFAVAGINASVVGLLMAAFYNPVWTSAIFSVKDFVFALGCFILLMFLKAPSWAVVILGAIVGGLL
ncbi:chromate efflux transporter [Bdellovibrio sp. SKB1291214]|uniref:chromate efflux transporter n=1 Tax=Bdellovibrio sp. SKB1291214 TaxID=1732569 RepID=UPI0020CBD10C|nr:chromate efflux transporter [Bdellovibrio sp. SKB1291214]UYL09466.1 chromate efflux transporter [Bdellovibrio sp. SKB1291214]